MAGYSMRPGIVDGTRYSVGPGIMDGTRYSGWDQVQRVGSGKVSGQV